MSTAGSSRDWASRMGGKPTTGPGVSLPPGMAEPLHDTAEVDEYVTQTTLKEDQLLEAIQRRRAIIAGIRSGVELQRCLTMLAALGEPESFASRIAYLEKRVHRAGCKRPSLFGGFRLGTAREERELRDLVKRRDTAVTLSERVTLLQQDPDALVRHFEMETSRLEVRLRTLRERRRVKST